MRAESAQFFRAQGLSDDAADGLALAACELVENAVKYGEWRGGGTIGVALTVEDDAARVAVESPLTDASRLEAQLAWVRSFPSAQEAYRARLRQVAESQDGTRGGLGLLRLAAEVGCALEHRLTGGVVTVCATLPAAAPSSGGR